MEQAAARELPLGRSADFAAVDHEVIAADFKTRHPLTEHLRQWEAKLFHIYMMTGRNNMREIHRTEVVVDGSASRKAPDYLDAVPQTVIGVYLRFDPLVASDDDRRPVDLEEQNVP